MTSVSELVARMVTVADHDATIGLAADALREGSEFIEAQAAEIARKDAALQNIAIYYPATENIVRVALANTPAQQEGSALAAGDDR